MERRGSISLDTLAEQFVEQVRERGVSHRALLFGIVRTAQQVLTKSAPDYAPDWSPLFRIHCVFPRRMANSTGLLIRVSVVRAHPGELSFLSAIC